MRIGVENRAAVDVPGGAANRLNEGAGGPQKPFLVRVENRDERNFRQVEAFAQQVDADEHVKRAEAQVAQNLDALQRVDVRVQIPHLDPELLVIRRQILGHALRQRRDEDALASRGGGADFFEEVVDLAGHGPDVDGRIDESRRPDDLLDDDAASLLELVRPRRRTRRTPPA